MFSKIQPPSTWLPRTPISELVDDNAYITDGERLFRCMPGEPGPTVILEDCLSLELIVVSRAELDRADMSLVRAGEPGDEAATCAPAAA